MIGTSLIQRLPLAGSGVRFILSPVGSGFPAFARAPFQMEELLPYHIYLCDPRAQHLRLIQVRDTCQIIGLILSCSGYTIPR